MSESTDKFVADVVEGMNEFAQLKRDYAALKEQRDSLIQALKPFSDFKFSQGSYVAEDISRGKDSVVVCGYTEEGTESGVNIKYSDFKRAKDLLTNLTD